jgi:hypothetical protein
VGADVASMLEAEKKLRRSWTYNVRLVQSDDALSALVERLISVYSFIVFQHILLKQRGREIR